MLQTADADVTIAAEEAVTACLLVCGSSSFYSAVAEMALADAATDVETAAATAVSGSSFFCSAVAAASAALAVDAIADATVDVDAN